MCAHRTSDGRWYIVKKGARSTTWQIHEHDLISHGIQLSNTMSKQETSKNEPLLDGISLHTPVCPTYSHLAHSITQVYVYIYTWPGREEATSARVLAGMVRYTRWGRKTIDRRRPASPPHARLEPTAYVGNTARPPQTAAKRTAARPRASCWAAGPYRCTRSPTDRPASGGGEACWLFVRVRAPRVLLHGNPGGLSGATTTTGCEGPRKGGEICEA